MILIRQSTPQDGKSVVDIWRAAVDATHDFLAPKDREDIEEEVKAFLPSAPLTLAVDSGDHPLGFLLLDRNHMEALFIDPAHRGSGIGRELVRHALSRVSPLTTDVNEQNIQAVGFYTHLGFKPTGRSIRDGQGRPYPLIHLRHDGVTTDQRQAKND